MSTLYFWSILCYFKWTKKWLSFQKNKDISKWPKTFERKCMYFYQNVLKHSALLNTPSYLRTLMTDLHYRAENKNCTGSVILFSHCPFQQSSSNCGGWITRPAQHSTVQLGSVLWKQYKVKSDKKAIAPVEATGTEYWPFLMGQSTLDLWGTHTDRLVYLGRGSAQRSVADRCLPAAGYDIPPSYKTDKT